MFIILNAENLADMNTLKMKTEIDPSRSLSSLDTISLLLDDIALMENLSEDLSRICSGISMEDVRVWFVKFRAGVEYVFKKYKIIATNLLIVENVEYAGKLNDTCIAYIPDQEVDAIVITQKFLAQSIQATKNHPYSSNIHLRTDDEKIMWVNSDDIPIVLGIEEAHHSFFFKTRRGQPMVPGRYGEDPAEIEAGKEIRTALKELGINTHIKDNLAVIGTIGQPE